MGFTGKRKESTSPGAINELASAALVNRGRVTASDRTSFEECTQLGYYSFSMADISNITDAPSGLSTAGILKVYKNSVTGAIHQFIQDINGNEWFRYNTNEFKRLYSQSKGSVAGLGYTAFSQCKETGYYSFSTADISNITDAPSGLSTAGILKVYKNSVTGAIHQFIRDLNGNEWFRRDSKTFIKTLNVSNTMTYVGTVVGLGYTTFAECTKPGYYQFSTADISSITDAPSDLNIAGFLQVFPGIPYAGKCYQILKDINGNEWFRTGTDGFVKIGASTVFGNVNWCALGDSITEGYYSYYDDNGDATYLRKPEMTWASKVAAANGYTLTNKAVGGSGYASIRSESNPVSNARTVVDTIDFSTYNLVTLAYGVNDWKYNCALGTFDDDITAGGTVYSNMRYVIEKILTDNPTCKIIVITPLNCCAYGTQTNNWGLGYSFSNNGTLEDIYTAQKEVCEYYGIEMIDLTHQSIINRMNIERLMPDGVHPSADCHTLIARELARKMSA